MENDLAKMLYYEVRLKAHKLVRYLEIHDPRFSTQNQTSAAAMIKELLRRQDCLNAQQFVGGFFFEAERFRRRGIRGWWTMVKLCYRGYRSLKRIDFGEGR